MRTLWLLWFPLLFLPNLGWAHRTPFGTLEISDFLILPFLFLSLAVVRWRTNVQAVRCAPVLAAFVLWALIGTFFVTERYGYPTDWQENFGLLKLSKFALYLTAGLLTSHSLLDRRIRLWYWWALLASGLVLGASLLLQGGTGSGHGPEQYSSLNATSVQVSVLASYLCGVWMAGHGGFWWRRMAIPVLLVMVLGSALSEGRGGWLAGLVGMSYLAWRGGFRRQFCAGAAGLILVLGAAYQAMPAFRKQVDKTLHPSQASLERYGIGFAGIDEGGRLRIWSEALEKLPHVPLLGTGFFHRGGKSGHWPTGSHNFFMQMFLETGIAGGLMALLAWVVMWRQAGSRECRALRLEMPLRCALLVSVVGGLGGEYFYGGMVLFTLLAVYAPCGSVPLGGPARPAPTGRLAPAGEGWVLRAERARLAREFS